VIKAIFLDRDGTLVKDYPDDKWSKIEHLELFPDTIDALCKVPKEYKLFIITNQYLISEGYITYDKFQKLHKKLISIFHNNSIQIIQTYYCPHSRNSNCGCCKPQPGMIEQCLLNYDVDLKSSYLIGNSAEDIKLAKTVGLKAIFVRGEDYHSESVSCAENLKDAIEIITNN
jgi:D-glycero-D-manno-heptose 1,7-bisphosphate phosphatase